MSTGVVIVVHMVCCAHGGVSVCVYARCGMFFLLLEDFPLPPQTSMKLSMNPLCMSRLETYKLETFAS